jgi:hypothetical protein
LLTSFLLAGVVLAAPPAGINWETDRALDQRLAQPVTLSWTNTPAGRALANLGELQHVAILLDRRVDPGQELTLAATGMRLGEMIAEAARQLDAGYAQYGPVAYIGPMPTAKALRTLAAIELEAVRKLPPERVKRLLTLRAWKWEDFAEPRQLATELASEAEIELVGAELIPHDLWRAADLPPLSWIDRMTLLAAQFDLTVEIAADGQRVRLAPLKKTPTIVRTYRVPGDAKALAARWAQDMPEARVIAESGEIRVEGRIEDHDLVEARFRSTPTRRTKVKPAKELYQFAVENAALDRVVAQLAERLQLDVKWDEREIEAAGTPIDQLITVSVKDATLDGLLMAVFQGTRLTFKRTDKTLMIMPATK